MDDLNILMNALQHAAVYLTLQNASHLVGEIVIKEEIKGLYKNIKARLCDLFHDKPEAKLALDQFEKQPETWARPLEAVLLEVKAYMDKELIQSAEKLISLINTENATISKYQINNRGIIKGSVVGDNAAINNYF